MTPVSTMSGKSNDYQNFLRSKQRSFGGDGFVPKSLPSKLYGWQSAIVRWALQKGRAALFEDCGLGKSFQQIAWADALGVRVLMFAPLCVAEQTISEAAKLGITIRYAHDQHEATDRLTITNYERLDKFDASQFEGVVLDESSILKSMDGKTRTKLIEMFADTRYRLCCTATPSPNDIAELANHAEFLGISTRPEFLATWFVHDDEGWRMKRHAVEPFYKWLSSWAVALRSPAELGCDATGFDLPPLEIRDIIVGADGPAEGMLFADMALRGLSGRLGARRASLQHRCAEVASLVLKSFCDSTRQISLPETLLPREQGQVQGLSAETQSQEEQAEAGTLQVRRGLSAQGSRRRSGLSTQKPAQAQSASAQGLQPSAGDVQVHSGSPRDEMCDLRILGDGPAEIVSVRGSLSPDEPSEGDSLLELQSRFREVQRLAGSSSESRRLPQWIIWCGLNAEQDELAAICGDMCVSVSGSDSQESKRRDVSRWLAGEVPILISKAAIVGWGMNFQNCANMAFLGLSDSYETYYQCIRRCWRYGQMRKVTANIIVSEAEAGIVANVRRKEQAAISLADNLGPHTRRELTPHLEAVA